MPDSGTLHLILKVFYTFLEEIPDKRRSVQESVKWKMRDALTVNNWS
ncbi:hypothetical protein MTBBW1_1430025 [Desulfamplus magnetovallimortis]|uniref:Uncharacterized protein n=1 Tax=Desulfamplus magnetovallimortis TaxID=1246637 RepID=A0A1W1H876_9BACT|nr:hypothetical protein MTBBW1_1430025 [Desulfamplus magnetovallimortis]